MAHVSLDSGFFVHVQEVLHSRKISINNSDSLVETTSCNKQMTICIIIPHVMYVVPELLLHNIYIKYNDYNMYIYIYHSWLTFQMPQHIFPATLRNSKAKNRGSSANQLLGKRHRSFEKSLNFGLEIHEISLSFKRTPRKKRIS